jgi:hypothetical protein
MTSSRPGWYYTARTYGELHRSNLVRCVVRTSPTRPATLDRARARTDDLHPGGATRGGFDSRRVTVASARRFLVRLLPPEPSPSTERRWFVVRMMSTQPRYESLSRTRSTDGERRSGARRRRRRHIPLPRGACKSDSFIALKEDKSRRRCLFWTALAATPMSLSLTRRGSTVGTASD